MVPPDHHLLHSIREILLSAHGALAVAMTHIQLANSRLQRKEDRITRDHLETAQVFTDSATCVIATVNEIVHRVEQTKNCERWIGNAG